MSTTSGAGRPTSWPELVHGAFTMGGVLATPRRRVDALARELGAKLRRRRTPGQVTAQCLPERRTAVA